MTINLNEYDTVTNKIDKSKTWLYVAGKTLISNELPKRKYYNIFKRFDTALNAYNFYIILSDINTNGVFKTTNVDNYGRVKVSISSIYTLSGLNKEDKDCNIKIVKTESDDNSDVYLIDY